MTHLETVWTSLTDIVSEKLLARSLALSLERSSDELLTFVRNDPTGWRDCSLVRLDRGTSIEVHCGVGFVSPEIESIFHQFSGISPDAQAFHVTIGTDIHRFQAYYQRHREPPGLLKSLRDRVAYRATWPIYPYVTSEDCPTFARDLQPSDGILTLVHNADAAPAVERILQWHTSFVEPYLAAYGSIEAVDRAYNSKPSVQTPHGGGREYRCFRGVIVARLLRRPDWQALVSEYRKVLARRGKGSDFYRGRFESLVDYLHWR